MNSYTFFIILLLINTTKALMKPVLYNHINCNIIDKLNSQNVYTNDYQLVFKNNTYNMIEKTNNILYNMNRMYCTEKSHYTLYLNCENYTIFNIYSSKHVIYNMINNFKNLEYKLEYPLYITNQNTLCYSEITVEEFYAFQILFIILLIVNNCFCYRD